MFPSTHWTLLAQATLTGDAAGRDALARLCENYRPPVVAFLRSRGVPRAEADDLTQDLFQRLLSSQAWKRADRERGKFRTFLLSILQHIMCSQWTRSQALKNGGGRIILSLESLEQDSGWMPAAPDGASSREFDRAWAMRTLHAAFSRVEKRWIHAERPREFSVYRRFLPGSQWAADYRVAAEELGVPEGTARTAVSRLRTELAEALRQEISLTVASPQDVQEELVYLRDVLASPGVDIEQGAAADHGDT